MLVFIGWCITDYATLAEPARLKLLEEMQAEENNPQTQLLRESLSAEKCLPEYTALCKAIADRKQEEIGDELTEDLLGISLGIVGGASLGLSLHEFNLADRLNAVGEVPVALAARRALLSKMSVEMRDNLSSLGTGPITFVGLPGTDDFIQRWALTCAVHQEPLPIAISQCSEVYELPRNRLLKSFLDSCVKAEKNPELADIYRVRAKQWLMPGASSSIDFRVVMAIAARLGFVGGLK